MTYEEIVTIRHLIHPGDSDKIEDIAFSLYELKYLQGTVIDTIKHEAREHNREFDCYNKLAVKLERIITNLES